MIKIKNIQTVKSYDAVYRGIKAKIAFNMTELWFSAYYYHGDNFICKRTHGAISEQRVIANMRVDINAIINNEKERFRQTN